MNNSEVEKRIEKAIEKLATTYPEQTYDAMSDYLAAYSILKPLKNEWRVKGIIKQLKGLYIYPTRDQHNALIGDLHGVKEVLNESSISKRLKAKTLSGLGALNITLSPIMCLAIGFGLAYIFQAASKKE
jgi:hypothetical protein